MAQSIHRIVLYRFDWRCSCRYARTMATSKKAMKTTQAKIWDEASANCSHLAYK